MQIGFSGKKDGDIPHDKCGVVGVYSPNSDISKITFLALYALQHRGQESAGIATGDGTEIKSHLGMGLVSQVFNESNLSNLDGHVSIGHTRYSTTGSSNIQNAQPCFSSNTGSEIALAHNGNVINALDLRNELLDWGVKFKSSADSEVIAHLITSAPGENWHDRFSYVMRRLQGAFSLTLITKDSLIAARDNLGVRPLCIGTIDDGYVVASETCALDHVGAKYLRDVEPGEVVLIDKMGLNTIYQQPLTNGVAHCVFEHVYIARSDSVINDRLVYKSRMAMGRELAIEHPVEADLVIGVPDSATAAAVGYAQQSGIPYGEGLIRNRYVGRTFILPEQHLRDIGVRRKLNPLNEIIRDKRLVVVDDSIVRGTTGPQVVALLRKGGAKEVHLRICAPPFKHPCYFGVDLPSRRDMIASNRSVEEICEFMGADSLGYLTIPSLKKAVSNVSSKSCMACFTGNYPIPVQLEMDKFAFEKTK